MTPEIKPIDMVLFCPACGKQHIDEPERSLGPGNTERLDWDNPPHRSHLCHGCGHIWRPADVPTNGVKAVQTKGRADSPIRHEVETGMNLLGEVAPAFIGAVSAYETYGKRHSLVGRAETDTMFTTRLADMKKVARRIHLFFKSE